MPSRLPSILAGIALVVVLGLYMCCFQVRTTEMAVLKTFGRMSDEPITEAGLYWRLPWPIQEPVKFDRRIRIMEDMVEETPTADGKNVTVTTYTGWRVADPKLFHTAYPDEKEAEAALRTKVRAHKKAVIGQHQFADFVSTDPAERRLAEIEKRMMDQVASEARKEFGVEIAFFGIKKLGLPADVTKTIFEYMKAEQNRRATRYEAEGKAKAQEILSEAKRKNELIMAAAQFNVDSIEADGRRRVGEIYRSFAEHPELRIFLDKLRALEETLSKRTTLILDTSTIPADLFDAEQRMAPAKSLKLDLDASGTPTREVPGP